MSEIVELEQQKKQALLNMYGLIIDSYHTTPSAKPEDLNNAMIEYHSNMNLTCGDCVPSCKVIDMKKLGKLDAHYCPSCGNVNPF